MLAKTGGGTKAMKFASRIVVACIALLGSLAAGAQSWPSRPVKIVVPFPAGGTTDVVARLLGQKLGEAWGQPVVIENRVGAGGNIGADVVAKSAPDGYTLLMTSGSIVTANPYMYKTLPFDPARDFVPITNVAIGPQTHLAAENFMYAAGIDMTHVPYKGESLVINDLMGGQIQAGTPNLGAAITQIQSGKLRALAVT